MNLFTEAARNPVAFIPAAGAKTRPKLHVRVEEEIEGQRYTATGYGDNEYSMLADAFGKLRLAREWKPGGESCEC